MGDFSYFAAFSYFWGYAIFGLVIAEFAFYHTRSRSKVSINLLLRKLDDAVNLGVRTLNICWVRKTCQSKHSHVQLWVWKKNQTSQWGESFFYKTNFCAHPPFTRKLPLLKHEESFVKKLYRSFDFNFANTTSCTSH